ncbi:TPA: hypothetical protein KNR75_003790 [Clostridioides difficile]|nr:hypothetical protein [Clostridioides difficile]
MDNINNEAGIEAKEAEIMNDDDKVIVKINDTDVMIDLIELNKMSKDKVLKTYNISKVELNKLLKEAGLYSCFQIRGKGKTLNWYKTKEAIEAIEAKKYTKKDNKEAKIDTKEQVSNNRIPLGLSIRKDIKQDLKECASMLNTTETDIIEKALEAYIRSNLQEIENKKREQDKIRNSIISKYK